jgi:hypothetical protein
MILNQNELKNINEINSIEDLEIYITNNKIKKIIITKLFKRNENKEELEKIINDYEDYRMSLEKFKATNETIYSILIKYEIDELLDFIITKNEFIEILKKL